MTTRYLWTLEREGRSTLSGLDTIGEIISIIVAEDVPGAMPADWWSRSCGSMPTRTDRQLTNLRWVGRCVCSILARLNESVVLGLIHILEQIEDAPKRIHLSRS
ncbi:hypothetical protein [Rhizobium sp. WYCCWR 11152]|uniref:hypothetical protein n=1 Tax=Rhizobium sp. WYCCWR 11152 TaxID=2692316 RepID=UPI001FEF96F5|nr:hypothetical protein [Rhizobium sp. WYCCWR 11152]